VTIKKQKNRAQRGGQSAQPQGRIEEKLPLGWALGFYILSYSTKYFGSFPPRPLFFDFKFAN